MENKQTDTEEQVNPKPKRFGILDWIILVICIFMLPGTILVMIGDGPLLFLSGKTDNLTQIVADIIAGIIWLALFIKGLQVKLKKFKELKTHKAYKTVVIITWIVSILILASTTFSIYSAFYNAKKAPELSPEQQVMSNGNGGQL